jgi:Cft2 family RNA processing exonuclease
MAARKSCALHPECFDDETNAYLKDHQDPFGFQRLTYIRDVNESKKLNDRKGPFMVISASGMCEAGRVPHHLRNGVGDSRNTVLLTGYQAEHSWVESSRTARSRFGSSACQRPSTPKSLPLTP